MKKNFKNQFIILTLVTVLFTLVSCSRSNSKSGCPSELKISNNIVSIVK